MAHGRLECDYTTSKRSVFRFFPQGGDECFCVRLAFLEVEMRISFSGITSTTRGFPEERCFLKLPDGLVKYIYLQPHHLAFRTCIHA